MQRNARYRCLEICDPALAAASRAGVSLLLGILGLVKRYGAARVDAACGRALVLGTRSYNSVATILKNHRENAATPMAEAPVLIHENIRGPGYYH